MHIVILAIGEIAYLFGWFAVISSLIAMSTLGKITEIGASYWGLIMFFSWLGWWIRRACCSKFGLFFRSTWEFPKFAEAVSDISGGLLLKFWGQLLFLLAIKIILSFIS